MDEAYNKLKQLSKKLNCTIIALHQFSNELKNDPDRFPNIFSLRGSGAPRHYADVICGIWRPEVYPDILKRNPEYKGKCQLVWQKVRYTKKPDVTEMNYNGYKFMEKVLDDTQGNANE
jgi:replicative DNA helicase